MSGRNITFAYVIAKDSRKMTLYSQIQTAPAENLPLCSCSLICTRATVVVTDKLNKAIPLTGCTALFSVATRHCSLVELP